MRESINQGAKEANETEGGREQELSVEGSVEEVGAAGHDQVEQKCIFDSEKWDVASRGSAKKGVILMKRTRVPQARLEKEPK